MCSSSQKSIATLKINFNEVFKGPYEVYDTSITVYLSLRPQTVEQVYHDILDYLVSLTYKRESAPYLYQRQLMCNACSKVRFSAALGDSTTARFLVTTILTIATKSPYSFMVMVQLMQGIYTTAAPNT